MGVAEGPLLAYEPRSRPGAGHGRCQVDSGRQRRRPLFRGFGGFPHSSRWPGRQYLTLNGLDLRSGLPGETGRSSSSPKMGDRFGGLTRSLAADQI